MKHCEIHEQKEITDKLREECGVFGIYDFSGENVASTIYYGLFALQHRGQESCGIAVSDTKGPKGKVLSHKGMGLVNEADSESMEKAGGRYRCRPCTVFLPQAEVHGRMHSRSY